MFQLSFGMMEFCPVGMPLADKWIIGFIHNFPPERLPARPTGVSRAGMKEFILSGRYRSVRAGIIPTFQYSNITSFAHEIDRFAL